ncbi:hypothetical protein V1508DRAFT_419793 [Lipomyces doorenjongii]|uniref:uncharacterized protein n=1 Tax=Lipomyces doorenjongii TaxID=383834 RepID=UPI0034CDF77A
MHVLSFLIQLSLYALTSSVLLSRFVPRLRYLLQYGKTLESITSVECALRPKYSLIESACDAILKPLGFTVPKRWFTHFYVLGLSLSAASSAMLYLCHSGKVTFPVRCLIHIDEALTKKLTWLLAKDAFILKASDINVSYTRAMAAITIVTLQCFRRLYECMFVEKMSQTARMRGGHYIVGHLFYVAATAATWSDALESTLAGDDEGDSVPKIAIIMYLVAALAQYTTHDQLSRLKKYSLTPPTMLFKHLVCPHYTAEVVIYLAVAWICGFTQANVAVLVWTAVSLGTSAEQSRKFYVEKFGAKAVEGKWNLVPFVF